MSCLCPISIPDKVAARYGIQGASLIVPCGHCTECARDHRNDWFVRLWSVYQRSIEVNEPVWFVTVTIDPDLWPGLNLDNPNVGQLISPFMRSWTERLRYLLNGAKMPLRFLCSEFGSKGREYIDENGVQRVTTGALHFHGLLFGYLPVKWLKSGFEKTHGYVDFSRIRGPQAIRYTVKYATKDYSIDDPLLRARTFCSPGIGDPSYYFGDSAPTQIVLINGFHYRTPRYFIEKQWLRLYGRDRFYDADGCSMIVRRNFEARLYEFRQTSYFLDSLKNADPDYRSFVFRSLDRCSRQPATLEQVRILLAQGKTGPSHPLLRSHDRNASLRKYNSLIAADRSFVEYVAPKIFIDQSQLIYNYERHQTFLSLPIYFST